MILASHNSWSYIRPKYWYMWPLRFMCKCQSKDIKNQWNSGARMFDLRLFFDEEDRVWVRHGILTFKVGYTSIMYDLTMLNNKAKEEKVYVRVILEQNHRNKNQEYLEKCFARFCALLKECFSNIIFISGARKFDNSQIFDFGNPEPKIIHKYSSTTALFGEDKNRWYAKLDDWWPWLYAHLHNADSVGKYIDEEGYLMLDYI